MIWPLPSFTSNFVFNITLCNGGENGDKNRYRNELEKKSTGTVIRNRGYENMRAERGGVLGIRRIPHLGP